MADARVFAYSAYRKPAEVFATGLKALLFRLETFVTKEGLCLCLLFHLVSLITRGRYPHPKRFLDTSSILGKVP